MISAFTIEPHIKIPKIANKKYSAEANFKAIAVIGLAIKASAKTPINVPMIEAVLVTLIASSALPCLAKILPSSAVAAADAVPGIFNKIADIEPP